MFRSAIVEGVTVDAFVTRSLRATGTSDLLESVNQWQLSQALNPPIKVTKKVLEAMKKQAVESKLLCGNVAHYKRYSDYGAYFDFYYIRDNHWYCSYSNNSISDEELLEADGIIATCPLALQVLLGFTTEGVPVND